ncbi:HTH-type transcriptional regulator GltC [Baekduia alba]|uniref:LysR family transcriptional regulator n=1 Tax=Baekduia alba TaxID=2997333 RepID=UPI00234070F5|nr:LysR family transcriptional regulator [Baekduia alba]WCB91880.1 HTH-type transcriptional regulator GltC [Baekduia alba]
MDLRQLRYLDAVARARSFTAAALDLHIAQSALSQQVAKLERELGVELLKRTTRKVETTEAGELVLARGRRALAEAAAIREDLDALHGLVRGSLKIGGVPPMSGLHPARLIAEFGARHPGIDITIREDVAQLLIDELAAGRLDLVLSLTDVRTLPPSLTGRRLVEEELVLILAPDHPLAQRKRIPHAALTGERLVAYGEGSVLRAELERLVDEPNVIAEVNELVTLRELVALGLGVTLMPKAVVAATPPTTLAVRPLHPRLRVPVAMIWRAHEQPTPAAAAFREHVLAAVARHP